MDIDLIGAIVFELDEEGRVCAFNRAALAFFATTADAFRGADFFDTHLPAPDRRESRSAFKRARSGKLGARDLVEMVVNTARTDAQLLLWRLTVNGERIVYAGMDLPDVLDRAHARSLKEL